MDYPYRLDMSFESFGDSLRMLGVLLCNESEITNLISIVDLKIFERLAKIIRNFS